LRIEAYFQQFRDLVDVCPVGQSSSITYDKRSTHEEFIRGEIYFVDGSVLHLREFVDVETTVERLLYVYQYMDARQQLQFRYDNQVAEHNRELATFGVRRPRNSRGSVNGRQGAFRWPRLRRSLRY
jgi:hypothetical protein